MRAIVRWAVKNSPAMNTLMVGVLLVGAVSLMSMRREVFPQFDLEIILVTVPYPGASPEEVEEGVCQKIEEAVRSVDGLKKQTSVAQEGAGFLVLELETWVDVQKVLNEVRSEIDRIPSFPELTEDPEIKQLSFREPAIRIGVIGPEATGIEAELELREVAERVRNEALRLPSVSQADVIGSRPYQIDVEMSEDRLREYGLTLNQVAQIIRFENLELPSGSIKSQTQEILIRGKNKTSVGTEIAKIPLVTQPNGVVLTVGDLGTVSDAFEDLTAINSYDGKPGLTVSIDRAKTEDLLKIVDEVKDYVAEAQGKMPAGYKLKTWGDKSVDVRDRMDLLLRNGLQGLVLVFLALALFLELELSFWVAMGIPICMLGSGVFLLYGGQTMNMLSMFSFLMALGIVVDDAIVIGENIYTHRQLHDSLEEAAIEGTVQVVPSVTASVSTTIIAFMPLLFVSGVMGKFIAVMPVAVIAMLIISLIESTLILPCHLAHKGSFWAGFLRSYCRIPLVARLCLAIPLILAGLAIVRATWPIGELNDIGAVGYVMSGMKLAFAALLFALSFADVVLLVAGWITKGFAAASGFTTRNLEYFVDRYYLPTLRWSLQNPALVISSAMTIMLLSMGLVVAGVTPFVIFPKTDTNEIFASISFPDGTPAAVTNRAATRIEQSLLDLNKTLSTGEVNVIQTARLAVGQVRDPAGIGPEARSSGSHLARIDVELAEASLRNITALEIIDHWREAAGEFPGAESITFSIANIGPGGTPIEFRLLAKANDMERLEAAVEKTKAKLGEYQGVLDIRDDSQPGKWEFQIQVKDKAKALGIPLSQLAQTVRGAYYGEEVMRLQRGRHEVKLMVRYPESERKSLTNFEEIRIRTGDGREYPLTELADVKVKRGFSEINRVDQLRSIAILADVDEKEANARETVADLQKSFMPQLLQEFPEVSVMWEGQQQQTFESVTSLVRGLAIALLAMFVLLTIEFRSYFQPLMIMAIIPFGIVGAIWGHAVMGLTITLFTIFGIVALTGVVMNDSIVLIDYINHRREEGASLYDALIDAGRRRFRPVLLTSVTTIAGLIPMLTETSFQAQFLIPLAATLVFGLLLATIMVLILIPVYYVVYGRLALGDRSPMHGPLPYDKPKTVRSQSVPVASAT
jgi:multidrug efflux pump subunit AcrB